MKIQVEKIRHKAMTNVTKMKIMDCEKFFLILTLKLQDKAVENLIVTIFHVQCLKLRKDFLLFK